MHSVLIKAFCPEIFLSLSVLSQCLFNVGLIRLKRLNFPILSIELFSQCVFILSCLFLLLFNQKIILFIPNFFFIFDSISLNTKLSLVLICIISFTTLYKSFLLEKINFTEYFFFFFFSLFSSLLLLNCVHLIAFYIIVEIQALSFYILASVKRSSAFSTEAGLKYFIIGSITSGVLILGSCICYACFGSFHLQDFDIFLSFYYGQEKFTSNIYVLFGFLFILFVLFLKIVVAPFHFWAPDVYEGSPLSSTIIFSLMPKLSLFTFLIRWLNVSLDHLFVIKPLLVFVGLFSLIFGAYFALIQKRFKRFIIYSSISQIGFVLIVLVTQSLSSLISVYLYLVVYLLTASILWGILTLLVNFNIKTHKFDNYASIQPVFLSDLASYFQKNGVLSLIIVLVFFSFSGIPPLVGFLSKLLVLLALISSKNLLIAIVIVLASAISSFYYLKIIKLFFFDTTTYPSILNRYITLEDKNFNLECIILANGTFLLFLIFFFPTQLISFIYTSVFFLL